MYRVCLQALSNRQYRVGAVWGISVLRPFVYNSVQALSNQKYRELQEQFGDVGLMTGALRCAVHAVLCCVCCGLDSAGAVWGCGPDDRCAALRCTALWHAATCCDVRCIPHCIVLCCTVLRAAGYVGRAGLGLLCYHAADTFGQVRPDQWQPCWAALRPAC